MPQHALIVGFGYVGRRLARALRSTGWQVSALVRSPEAKEAATSLDVSPINGDLDAPESLTGLPSRIDVVFYLAPPPQTGTTDPRVDHFLAAIIEPPQAYIYISTTGVYGDHGGGIVTEESPVDPHTDRAKRRVYAENALQVYAACHPELRHVVLRVGGIYGPDKLPLARLQRKEPVVEDPKRPSYVNVIHADDLVAICVAAAERAPQGAVYNVCSNRPLTMASYMDTVADAAQLPRPTRISWARAKTDISAGMLSYLSESRRISSDKIVRELDLELSYGDIKEGVAAALRESSDSPA